MDNYLLLGHILRCKVIPKAEVDPHLWVGANRKFRSVPRDRLARVKHNKTRTEEEQEKAEARLLRRQEDKKRKIEEAGLDYDFSAVAYVSLYSCSLMRCAHRRTEKEGKGRRSIGNFSSCIGDATWFQSIMLGLLIIADTSCTGLTTSTCPLASRPSPSASPSPGPSSPPPAGSPPARS